MTVGNPVSLLITPNAATTNLISYPLLMPNETCKIQPHLFYVSNSSSTASYLALRFKNTYFFSSPLQFRRTHFSSGSLLEKNDDILRLYAIKKPRESGTTVVEMSDFDDMDGMDDDFDDFDDENEDYEDEDEDAGMFLPLGKMKKWLENKPRGFGEGKVYNTSIEDELLEEMEQSRKAQAANINNLKNNPASVNSASNNNIQNKKVPDVVPSGIRVRIVNLPKKKNIHRDLKSAFKEVIGVVNIIPAVSGNKKTKDPICKGFAFVDFKSEEDANRFVQQFSGQTVAFGRTQKRIKCMMLHSSNSSDDESAGSFYSGLNSNVPALEDGTNAYIDTDCSSFEENSFDVQSCTDAEHATTKLNGVTDNMESFCISELNTDDAMEPTIEPTSVSFFSKKQNKNMGTRKKIIGQGSSEKVPKMEIPGSAKRLKIKEKAVLRDVFTKYILQSPPSSMEKS